MENIRCDCGEILSLSSHQIVSYNFRLKSNGTAYKHPYEIFKGDSESGELFCELCSNTYEVFYSEELGSYYKGELI